MPKGSVEDTRAATRAVLCRDKIRQLEIAAADFQGRPGEDGRALLRMRDEVDEELSDLGAQGLDLRPERTRVKTVDNILVRKAGSLERALGPTGGFPAARRDEQPPEERWWWFLDDMLAERRRKGAIRFIVIVIAAGVLLIGGNWLLNRRFGLTPEEREARTFVNNAEQGMMTGDYESAIDQYQQALQIKPDLVDAWVGLGVIYDLQGREAEAQQALARAEDIVGDRANYLMVLARSYSSVGEYERALGYANEAVALAPDSAQALIIRGGVYEATERRAEALADYELSATLAQEAGEDALYVLARMRMGMLLQSGSGGGSGMPGSF